MPPSATSAEDPESSAPPAGPGAATLRAGREIARRRAQRAARRMAIGALGGAIVLAGIVMLALPGPGALVIVLGLWVLSLEFDWAQRRLDTVQVKVIEAAHASTASRARTALSLLSALAMIIGGVGWGLSEDWPLSSWWAGGTTAAGGVLAGATALWVYRDGRRKPG